MLFRSHGTCDLAQLRIAAAPGRTFQVQHRRPARQQAGRYRGALPGRVTLSSEIYRRVLADSSDNSHCLRAPADIVALWAEAGKLEALWGNPVDLGVISWRPAARHRVHSAGRARESLKMLVGRRSVSDAMLASIMGGDSHATAAAASALAGVVILRDVIEERVASGIRASFHKRDLSSAEQIAG
jgi:hypothetical protein